MCDLWMDVDAALSEVPVNLVPLTDATDFKTIEDAVAYNAAGMALYWHFVTTAGAYTVTAVTPTTGGTYDWTDQGAAGIYTIEIPASGGASINNDTEGFGWFTGSATGVLPWRGPVIGFRAAALNNALIDGGDTLDVNVIQMGGTTVDLTAWGIASIGILDAGAAGGGTLPSGQRANVAAGQIIWIPGKGDGRLIAAGYNSTTGVFTVDSNFASAAAASDPYIVFVSAAASTTPPTVDVTKIAGSTVDTTSAQLGVNVVQISADATAADNLEAAADGTGYNLGGGSVVAASVTGAVGSVTGAVGSVTGAVGSVTGNVGGNVAGSVASVTATVNANVTQLSGDTTAADNAEAFFDGTGYAGTGNTIPTVTTVASVTAIATGGITAGSIAADAIGASELAADAITEIQSGLATASALSTVAGYLDTEVAAILAAVDTEVTAIKAKTDLIPASPAATGDAMALTSGERSTLAAAILDLADAIETGLTPRQAFRLIAAGIVGKLSGAGTSTEVFRNAVADSKARITATVDSSGNRSAITTDAT